MRKQPTDILIGALQNAPRLIICTRFVIAVQPVTKFYVGTTGQFFTSIARPIITPTDTNHTIFHFLNALSMYR